MEYYIGVEVGTTATHQWIYIYRNLQQARRRQNRTEYAVFNRKQNLRSTYCRFVVKLMTDMKHRAASLRQQSYLFTQDQSNSTTLKTIEAMLILGKGGIREYWSCHLITSYRTGYGLHCVCILRSWHCWFCCRVQILLRHPLGRYSTPWSIKTGHYIIGDISNVNRFLQFLQRLKDN